MNESAASPNDPLDPRVVAALRGENWRWLRTTVRRRLERDRDAVTVTLDLAALSAAERETLGWLLGRTFGAAGRARIRLQVLNHALSTRVAGRGVVPVLGVLDGPLDDHKSARDQRRAAVEMVWTSALAHPALDRHPELARWLDGLRSARTLPADPARRAELLRSALDVLAALPTPGVGLGTLAARVLGRAHALDGGTAVARLVLRALAHLAAWDGPPEGSEAVRTLWERFGVSLDSHASHVLTVGLRPSGAGPLAVSLRAHSAVGAPFRVTLDQLDRHRRQIAEPGSVWVCENPVVLSAAAERYGQACPPVVCVEGWPSLAARLLLRRVVQDGAVLHYHGDFDWPGLAIAEEVMNLGARPWRMRTEDYLRAARRDTGRLPTLRVPAHVPAYTWAGDLVASMNATGLQVEEEHVLADLLADMGD